MFSKYGFLLDLIKYNILCTSRRNEFGTVINTLIEIQLRFLPQQIYTCINKCVFLHFWIFSVKTGVVVSVAYYNIETLGSYEIV